MPPIPHQGWMSRICGVCTRKTDDPQSITASVVDNLLDLIHKWSQPKYDVSLQPSVLCKSCVMSLRHIEEFGLNQGRNLPNLPYDTFRLPVVTRQQDQFCNCHYCTIGRLNGQRYLSHCKSVRASQGRPSKKPPQIVPKPATICQLCQGNFPYV